jgi:hypothetical protein
VQGVPLQLESAEWSAWGAVHPLLSILTMVAAAFVLASVGSLVGGLTLPLDEEGRASRRVTETGKTILNLLMIVVGLSLSASKASLDRASSAAVAESEALIGLHSILERNTGGLPGVDPTLKPGIVQEYVERVESHEWATLSYGNPDLDPGATRILESIRARLDPEKGSFAVKGAWERLSAIERARRDRLATSEAGVPLFFWSMCGLLLCIGCAFTTPLCLGRPRQGAWICVVAYSVCIGTIGGIIREFERPWTGWIRIDPGTYTMALDEMLESEAEAKAAVEAGTKAADPSR